MLAIASEEKKSGATEDVLPIPTAEKMTAEVRLELEAILSSELFRSSKRSQRFLRYVVEAACSEPAVELKERTLGMAIWNRRPDYDTGTDAIVRVRANEIRRRLTQYNLSANPERAVKITLEPGSYVPQIQHRVFPITPSPEVPVIVKEPFAIKKLGRWVLFIVAGAVLIAGIAFGARQLIKNHQHSASAEREFWDPIIAPGQSIVCTAAPSAYRRVPFPPDKPSDSNVALRIRDELQHLGGLPRIGKAEDVSLNELQRAPYVLIGGPGINQWTMKMTNDLRFEMGVANQRGRIIDKQNPLRYWEPLADSDGNLAEDYILISRVLRSESGQPMVAVAGITQYGSLAGGKFLTDETSLEVLNRFAPPDWDRKNFQLVLKTKIHNRTLAAPEVVSAVFW